MGGQTEGGETSTATGVVVAIGRYRTLILPGVDKSAEELLHSADYRNARLSGGQNVFVTGG
jgi:cation diffusion facilitator CzcD-associated flavoprotein CzcO